MKKLKQLFAFAVSLVLLLSTMNFHGYAQGVATTSETNDWTFSAFGGNTSTTKNPQPTIDEGDSVTMAVTGGKIASGDEGLSYYFSKLLANSNFEIKAKATVKSFNGNSGISTPNQKSFGIMLRDKVGSNGDSSTQTANYVAVGALDTVMKGLYKKGTQTKLNPFVNQVPPKANEVYELSIKKSGNTYVLSSNNETETITVNDLFNEQIFAGVYVARDAEVTFSNVEITFAKQVSELILDSSQMKTKYFLGEGLDLTGLKVTGVYPDGSQELLTEDEYIVTGFKSSQEGTNTISINYNGLTQLINLTIKSVSVTNLEIKYYPAKTDYYVGDHFDPEGIVIVGEFENGLKEELTSDKYELTISGESITTLDAPGTVPITVTSTKTPETFTTFHVEVKDEEVTDLKITQLPQKTLYFINDELDIDGMVVYATYSDGNEVRLLRDEYSVTELDSTLPGKKDILITYKGQTDVLEVTVKEKELSGISITHYPKTTYQIGDKIDMANLEISKVYDNQDKEKLTDDQYSLDTTNFNHTVPGIYDVKVVPIDSRIEPITLKVTVREPKHYSWNTIRFGQSTDHDTNYTNVEEDGTIEIVALEGKAGKITGDHDGITFYYTEIDALEDNFSLTADIKVREYAKNPHDGQESFGIMARDVIGEDGNSSVFASNIVGIGGYSGGTQEANGTQFFIRTGVESSDGAGSLGIQKIMLKNVKPATNNTYPTNDYKLTLSKTNSGFVGRLNNDKEEIFFEPEILNVQDSKIYVGFYTARLATIEVSNIDFNVTAAKTDVPKLEPPVEPIVPDFNIISLDKVSKENYEFMVQANVSGTVTVKQGTKVIRQNAEVKSGEIFSIPTTLASNNQTNFSVTFLPNDSQYLSSYDKLVKNFTTTMKSYVPDGDIYVAPNGTSKGSGTKENPLDLDTAIDFVREGQKIIVQEGQYVRQSKLEIRQYNDGSKEAMKYLIAAPGTRPVIDFNKRSEGVVLSGDYWHIKGIDFARSGGNTKGFTIGGSHNIVENSRFYQNGDTGLQISRTDNSNNKSEWPSYNLILNSTSFDNRDPSDNNADGFAAKLTSGVGNIFRGCIAHHNIDDGWDLYTKAGTGAIGPVLIEDSIAYSNGFLTDGTVGNGDKNGFKLGGEGIHVPHIIRNSMAFGNGADGFTSNSNPGVIAIDNIAYNNAGSNLSFNTYGHITPDFTIDGFVSYQKEHQTSDNIPLELSSDRNFLFNGSFSANQSGVKLTDENFASLEAVTTYERDVNGNIIWGDFLRFRVLTEVEFSPAELNLNSNGVVTVYLQLQEGFNLEEIKFDSIRLNGEIKPINENGLVKNPIYDHDSDGVLEYVVKFSRKELAVLLTKGDNVPVTISGHLQSGTPFFGETHIKVK
ncbi:bacterial Ig-like domain-containing protein [Peribacillus alkalitolerans]|uniref:bacterial Ig-like domain-containing protein n=1 Tax=Peribacillus alkalitolerans TaxID=1550385 RepID=UPI001966FD78|nr:bacterial Ig-like domain-containing protein [Peribacillus alkalitolerans]